MTATVAFCPAPSLSYPTNSIVFVVSSGRCAYTSK
uniref:DNA-directed RNA polymerase III subunit, putative n=1 Tax=Arundo donax TaxID=35708 RepID=A0A0A9CV17_ARUDO